MSQPKNQLPLRGVAQKSRAVADTPAPTGDFMQAQAAFQATGRHKAKPQYGRRR